MARAKCGDIGKLSKYFNKGKDFVLTQEKYEEITGGILSKNIYYIEKQSKLSRVAKENNYTIEVEPIEVKPMKIFFKKNK